MEREGYQAGFIGNGIVVNHPAFSPKIAGAVYRGPDLREGIYLDYIHYTLVMNKKTRQLLYVASNIDQNNFEKIVRERDVWNTDSRMPDELQLENEYYSGTENPYDRGHMVRRANNCWGDTPQDALKANNDTFFYTNASLQHKYFNQDEWLALEEQFLRWSLDDNGKLCVMTGPVWRPFDRSVHRTWDDAARIPSAFFKIICYKGKTSKKLETRAFLLYQDEEFTNNKKSGGAALRANKFAKYQVSIADIENLTGLGFDDALPDSNPIYYNTPSDPKAVKKVYRYPERVPIILKKDLVNNILANRETQEASEEDKVMDFAAALVNPKGRDRDKEWISLLNKSHEQVTLKGWVILNNRGKVMKLKGKVEPGETIKLMTKDFKGFSLANSDGILVLRNPEQDTVDVATYAKEEATEDAVIRF